MPETFRFKNYSNLPRKVEMEFEYLLKKTHGYVICFFWTSFSGFVENFAQEDVVKAFLPEAIADAAGTNENEALEPPGRECPEKVLHHFLGLLLNTYLANG